MNIHVHFQIQPIEFVLYAPLIILDLASQVIVDSYIQHVENNSSTQSVAGMMSGFMTSSMAVATGSNKVTLFKISVSMFGKR